eukprot:CAMPEP_0114577038 /NCGR_PEP_ID=MMETSP0125-20121206/1741_1 /TAXON_ID=485358 ORGANISM="Aristerostoma sp., Strain ATCC 50986" /NCGR_SAMPLE_ID=MMETSP0125 /ASSEMBLY_ACC=CAM_ASM_000245 /LENGTH=70 /DNA_ID=CAMNT_0001766035 /DNA_START=363 /DNA_END=575 /DNA_ORIENTATION=-
MDLLMFKEIFVEPKQKVLHNLKDKEKAFSNLIHKGASTQYDKILGIYKDEDKKTQAHQKPVREKKLLRDS